MIIEIKFAKVVCSGRFAKKKRQKKYTKITHLCFSPISSGLFVDFTAFEV